MFVKVWRNLNKFDSNKTFRPWRYRIAKNTALYWLKKKSPAAFSDFETDQGAEWLAQSVVDEAPQPHILTDRVLLREKFALALKKLSPQNSEMISLRHIQDLNFRQIAKIKRESINTVKSRYRRAVFALKKVISK